MGRRGAASPPRERPPHGYTTGLLILQPTTFCNIDCRYCYLPARSRSVRMSLGTVAAVLPNLAASGLTGRRMTAVWHAGEPLAVPLEFYRDAFRVLRGHGVEGLTLSQAIQTNGTLITDAHCELFRRESVHVSVSIDGPEFLHDRNRVGRDGRGTFARVMNGVRLLRRHAIPFNAICVLTAEALDHADAVYDFFADQNIGEVGFNIDELEGVRRETSFAADLEEKYSAFFRRILERSAGPGGIRVREIRELRRTLARPPSVPQNNQTVPFAILTVAANGDFTTFSPELLGQAQGEYAGFTLGNIHVGLVTDCVRTDLFKRMTDEVAAGVEACARSCESFEFCGGGGPSNKIFENGSFASTETVHCRYTVKNLLRTYLQFLEATLPTSSEGDGNEKGALRPPTPKSCLSRRHEQ